MPKSPPKMNVHRAPQPKRIDWGTSKPKRITGHKLQRERRQLFRDQPVCVECAKHGRISVSEVRDHIKPLAFGGADVRENTQALCVPCHDAKSKAEAAEGARRNRPGRGA